MTAPRLTIDLNKIHHNACTLVQRLDDRGIAVTGVTKATLGSPEIANTLIRAGVRALGDSRIENIESMRSAGVTASMTLRTSRTELAPTAIRTPCRTSVTLRS